MSNRSTLTNRLLMVRLAHRSGQPELFDKNMRECLRLAKEYDTVRNITGDQEQELMEYPWFDCEALQEELHLG